MITDPFERPRSAMRPHSTPKGYVRYIENPERLVPIQEVDSPYPVRRDEPAIEPSKSRIAVPATDDPKP